MRFVFIRLILAIVAHLDLELFQMDVKTIFLNGELDEEIYNLLALRSKNKGAKCAALSVPLWPKASV